MQSSQTQSFYVDDRVSLKLDYDLAVRLGEFLLQAGTEDKQIMALAYKLNNLVEEEEARPVRFSNIVNNSYKYKKEGFDEFGKNWKKSDIANDVDSQHDKSSRKIQIRKRQREHSDF